MLAYDAFLASKGGLTMVAILTVRSLLSLFVIKNVNVYNTGQLDNLYFLQSQSILAPDLHLVQVTDVKRQGLASRRFEFQEH